MAALGMSYIDFPVVPTECDFDAFCGVLEQTGDAATQVHCIANYLVSAFFYRYRVNVIGMDEVRARADLEAVWRSDAAWVAFINHMRHNG